jgi:hypothetical protein
VPTLHIAYLDDDHHRECVGTACEIAKSEPEAAGWSIVQHCLTPNQGGFKPLDFYSTIAPDLGPILFVGSMKRSAITFVETKVARRVVSEHCEIADEGDVYEAILDLIQRHNSGEPEWPRRLGVALLLVAKLARKNYWGGTALGKNYLRVDDLANGGGLDQQYKGDAHEIADYLASEQRSPRLLSKKLGDGRPKYSCNSADRAAVFRFLRERSVEDEATMRWLNGDTRRIPNSELGNLDPEEFLDRRASTIPCPHSTCAKPIPYERSVFDNHQKSARVQCITCELWVVIRLIEDEVTAEKSTGP